MKSKSLVLMVVSLGFGLVAAVGISQVMGKSGAAAPEVAMGTVLVATDHLDTHTILTEENVKLMEWPIAIIPEGAATSLDDIANQATNTRKSKDMPIMLGDMINKTEIAQANIPPGKIVVAIKVPADDTINGLLQPADRVNVIGVFKIRQDNQNVVTSTTIIKNIEVYAIDARRRNTGTREEQGRSSSSVVAVLVTPRQAEILTLVQKEAQLKLALRGAADENEEQVDGEKLVAEVFGRMRTSDDENEDESEESGKGGKGGGFGKYWEGMVGSMEKPRTMRVWTGFQPETYTFDPNGGAPRSDAAGEAVQRPPQTPPPSGRKSRPDRPDRGERGDSADDEDYNRSNEIDRGLDSDQYPDE